MLRYYLTISLFYACVSFDALAQESNTDKIFNRIQTLESQLDNVERKLLASGDEKPLIIGQDFGGDTTLEPRVSNLEVHLSELNKRVKSLHLEILALREDNKSLKSKINNLLEDIVKEVENQYNNTAKPVISPPSIQQEPSITSIEDTLDQELSDVTIAPAVNNPTHPKLSAQDSYKRAFAYIEHADYDKAIAAFKDFLHHYPKHALASNAYYWSGEAYYAQKKYRDASVKFLNGYNHFPQGRKAPDNLLKLGMALGQIGEIDDACKTFAKLENDFSNAPPAITQRLKLEKYRLKCK